MSGHADLYSVWLNEQKMVNSAALDALLAEKKQADEHHVRCTAELAAQVSDARAENQRLREKVTQADDLLRRLSEWDMLYVTADGTVITADAPYWQGEIKRAREALAGDT